MQQLIANLENQFRPQTFDGRAHLVAPVVLMVEGVHTGTSGIPLYYSSDDLSESAHLWNGVPVPVFHPSDEQGEPVSANQPDVIEESVVGRLFNVWFDSNGNKLRGEVWIDAEKTRQVSSELLTAIRGGENLEVSTGLYYEMDNTSGDWNGEHYDAVVRDIRPDHLALLPGQVGACSWADGCGIRANQTTKGDMDVNVNVQLKGKSSPCDDNTLRDSGLLDKLKVFAKQFAALFGYSVQESSHEDIRAQIQAQLDAMDNAGWFHFVRDIYDDYFIYEARYRGDNPSDDVVAGAQKFYRRGYSIGDDEQITLAESPTEVREVREWVPATMQVDDNNDNQKQNHKEESNVDKKKELIDGLVANEKAKFDETDRKWLDGLTEEQLTKLVPCVNEDPPPVKPPEKPPEPKPDDKPKDAPKADPKPEGNKEPVTVDHYVANAPPEIAAFLTHAVAEQQQKKDALVKEIVANKRCKFTQEQLEAKDVAELESLAELANVKVDFSGRSGAPTITESEPLKMPPVFEKVTN